MTFDGTSKHETEVLIIGAGQAGLALGYYFVEQNRDFIILDGGERIGDSWRNRWDSLRLFTPAALSSLPGMPHKYRGNYFLTKDETADYLEEYAERFGLPIRLEQKVNSLKAEDGGYVATVGEVRYFAENVVVATGAYREPRIPDFRESLDNSIVQIHSSEYRSPGQLPDGDVLVVGAGNSGAEISLELADTRRVFLAGRDTGNVPGGVRGEFLPSRTLLAWRAAWWLLSRVNADTKLGRKGREYSRTRGVPLVRFSPADIEAAGIERVPRVKGVSEGRLELSGGRNLEVESIVWATGFRPDYDWIELSVFGEDGYPVQREGAVEGTPGLYFIGLPFLHTFFSETIGGAGEDARLVAEHLART